MCHFLSVLTSVLTVAGAFCSLTASQTNAQQLLYSWEGEAKGDKFGGRLGAAGDTDNDGVPDLLIGATEHDEGDVSTGRAYLYSGRTGQLLRVYDGEERTDRLGAWMASAGDLDTDGFADFMVAASGAYSDKGGNKGGEVYVYSGRTGARLRKYGGSVGRAFLGAPTRLLTDIDGDGFPEHMMSAMGWAPWGGDYSRGRVYVYSGKSGDLLHTWTGENEFDGLGVGLSDAGDVDGDGVHDVLACSGSYGLHDSGKAYVYSGASGNLIFSVLGQNNYEGLGLAASGAGDLDDDGYDDILVAAQGFDSVRGRVLIYSGPQGTLLDELHGENTADQFGTSVASVGDANGDGTPDFLVGAVGHDSGGPDAGRVYLYSGRTRRLLYHFTGVIDGQFLGADVSAAGDLNADGLADFMFGGPIGDGGDAKGWAYVHAGNDLFLQPGRPSVGPGEDLELFTRGGTPGALMLLSIVAINGAPFFRPLWISVLDSAGDRTFKATVPQGLSGLEVAFQTFAQRNIMSGRLADSLPETVLIE